VLGSGCGVYAGRADYVQDSSGHLLMNFNPGTDAAAEVPSKTPFVWKKGSHQEVAWAITANHGGGYSYRLCPKSGNVSEECFQRHVLRFAGDKQWIQYGSMEQMGDALSDSVALPRVELPLVRISNGTFPEGSEWARNPIPSCKIFDQSECPSDAPKEVAISCAQAASGYDVVQCPPGMAQFAEPYPGLSGHVPFWRSTFSEVPQWSNSISSNNSGDPPVSRGFPFSIVDKVMVPDFLVEGDYLLSWRWDCEQSAQVFQNCADIKISSEGPEPVDADAHEGSEASPFTVFP